MSKGEVTEYDSSLGYGRIMDSLTGESLVVYAKGVDSETGQSLQAGQSVEFETEYHTSQNCAVYVRIV